MKLLDYLFPERKRRREIRKRIEKLNSESIDLCMVSSVFIPMFGIPEIDERISRTRKRLDEIEEEREQLLSQL